MITIHTLISDHNGAGRKVLQAMCDFADQNGETIVLSADSNISSRGIYPTYEKTAALVDFYRSYGFKACDRDYWDGDTRYQINVMERVPRVLQHPYISEWSVYGKTPAQHRWIYNKLDLCERLGQPAWPVGSRVPAGEYCVRPIMNIQGMARGGFRKVTLNNEGFIQDCVGHVITPWTDAPRSWHLYVNDEPFSSQTTVEFDGELETMIEHDPTFPLPEPLRNISRYMLVETLGDVVIDVGPRHMVEEMKQAIVDDYRQFDPDYNPPSYGKWGFQPHMKRRWSESLQAWTHEEVEND